MLDKFAMLSYNIIAKEIQQTSQALAKLNMVVCPSKDLQ